MSIPFVTAQFIPLFFSGATHLLESGVDLYYIQRLMGHTTAQTTAIYLHVTRKDLTKVRSPIDLLEDLDDPIL